MTLTVASPTKPNWLTEGLFDRLLAASRYFGLNPEVTDLARLILNEEIEAAIARIERISQFDARVVRYGFAFTMLSHTKTFGVFDEHPYTHASVIDLLGSGYKVRVSSWDRNKLVPCGFRVVQGTSGPGPNSRGHLAPTWYIHVVRDRPTRVQLRVLFGYKGNLYTLTMDEMEENLPIMLPDGTLLLHDGWSQEWYPGIVNYRHPINLREEPVLGKGHLLVGHYVSAKWYEQPV